MVIIKLDAWYLITKGYGFYAWGYNKYQIDLKNGTIHAEEDAINKLKFTKKNIKVNVLIFRVGKNKKILSGKPCLNCQKILRNKIWKKGYNLKKVIYTIETNKIGILKNSQL